MHDNYVYIKEIRNIIHEIRDDVSFIRKEIVWNKRVRIIRHFGFAIFIIATTLLTNAHFSHMQNIEEMLRRVYANIDDAPAKAREYERLKYAYFP